MICPNEVPAPAAQPAIAAAERPSAGQLFSEYAPRIYRLARLLLGNDADAEDATAQAFLHVARKLPTFRGESSISTWLNRVAVNAALALRRRRAAQRRHEGCEPTDEFATDGSHAGTIRRWAEPLPRLIDRETHELIERAIAGLPEPYRDVFVLADVEERPNAEVAELLGLSLAAVKSRLHRARLLLRKALAPYFEEAAA
jgi:RNA polymerase sigma-70 factor (ECF subfamily)